MKQIHLISLTTLALLFGFAFSNTSHAQGNGLAGIYDMAITINGRDFVDVLEVRSPAGPIDTFYRGPIIGSLTVVGSFTSPLEGTVRCAFWSGICSFQFSILANENGQTFKVNYVGAIHTLTNMEELSGSASLENGELLGKFKAVRRKPDGTL